jgi:two-component system, NarL family, response regulator NreC
MITLHIADDHDLFRCGLRAMFDADPRVKVVGETGNGFDTLRWFEDNQAELLLLDMSMPGLSGPAVARDMAQTHPNVKILVLTMHNDESYLRQVFKLGCRGFILKSSSGEQLQLAIQAIAKGEVFVDPAMAKYLLSNLVEAQPSAATNRSELTPRELEVCSLLARGHTNVEVAELLCVSRRTVESHRSAIMDKLELSTRAELVRFALDHGLFKP